MAGSDETAKLVGAYRDDLSALGRQGREEFVDAARRNEDWPEPQERYLAGHARKWAPGKRAAEYAQLAYDIKNQAGTIVLAYIHHVHYNRGLAFVDLSTDYIVQFDTESNLNYDCFRPPNGAKRWMTDKIAAGTHWRLTDTER